MPFTFPTNLCLTITRILKKPENDHEMNTMQTVPVKSVKSPGIYLFVENYIENILFQKQ